MTGRCFDPNLSTARILIFPPTVSQLLVLLHSLETCHFILLVLPTKNLEFILIFSYSHPKGSAFKIYFRIVPFFHTHTALSSPTWTSLAATLPTSMLLPNPSPAAARGSLSIVYSKPQSPLASVAPV